MANWIRDFDDTRLVQYEGGDPEAHISDIRCPMYPTVEKIITMLADNLDKRPIVLVEYAYSMTNSGGGFYKYWNLIERFESFQGGGFVWDWQDKAIETQSENGEAYWGYGGDLNEPIDVLSVGYMCANGVVTPDLDPKPAASEIRNCQSPVKVDGVNPDNGHFLFKNRCQAWKGSHFQILWEIIEDGVKIVQETMPAPAAIPMSDTYFTLDYKINRKQGCEYFINLFILLAQDTFWAPKGHELFRIQFPFHGVAVIPYRVKNIQMYVLVKMNGQFLSKVKKLL